MPKIDNIKNTLQDFERHFPSGDECRKISSAYNFIVSETRDFVKKSGFDDVVIGLSGGIDSALVAKIAVDAFKNEHVFGLILPGPYSSQSSIADANTLAQNLNIKTKTIMINSAYESVMSDLRRDSEIEDLRRDTQIEDLRRDTQIYDGSLVSQNVQARLRMIYIMAHSNKNKALMLNTANKSEVYTGYSTLYGDMAGSFAPLGNTYKTDVFKMAVHVNLAAERRGDIPPIPQNIIEKAPSAELCENQTDEKSLDIDYPMLDAILSQLVDRQLGVVDIVSAGFGASDVQKVAAKVKRAQFKLRYEPPAPQAY